MKTSFSKILFATIVIALGFASCRDKVTPPPASDNITGSITADTTWSALTVITIEGFVYVESGATLTIEPGCVIKGDKATKGTLIIKPGGKIMAVGTANNPIVFTSDQPKGSRNRGDWGGVVILGNAPVNKTPIVVEGENLTNFGGTNAADNSGKFKYVRIEFAGIAFEPDKEINSLTLGAVGSGTEIDYVQVSYGNDDSYEWFGGTVNCKHLISYRGLDDDFDTDNGYSGNVQYAVALRDPLVADQFSGSVSNGFESDNDGSGTNQTPLTSAKFANVSIFMGPGTRDNKYNSAVQIRRNSSISVYNSLFVGPYKTGLEIKDASNTALFRSGGLNVKGCSFVGADVMYKINGANASDSTLVTSNGNNFNLAAGDLQLNANYNVLNALGFLPLGGSPVLSNGVSLPTGFEANTVRGAFGTTDWTLGWVNFDPQNTDY